MINFATLQGLTIPEGIVNKIEVNGKIVWKVVNNEPIILEASKITSDTYAGGTTYTGEQFILFDIYPKPNGTVSITYGGLTKTITDTSGAEEPNAIQVFFGTFNGVTDEAETPISGTVTIKGGCAAFAIGKYYKSKSVAAYCGCITAVQSWSGVKAIPQYAFYKSSNLVITELPEDIVAIGDYAFTECTNISLTELPDSITTIGAYAFSECPNIGFTTFPSALTTIGERAFEGYNYSKLPSVIPEGVVSIGAYAFYTEDYRVVTETDTIDILLPSTIESIGECAFTAYGPSGLPTCYLGTITILATTPPLINGEDGLGYSNLIKKIIVPSGCSEAYKTAEYWSEYADRIMEVS